MRNKQTELRDLIEELAKLCSVRDYEKGEFIYLLGDPSDSVYLIKQGHVKLFLTSETGRKLTLSLLGQEELFGEEALAGEESRGLTAEALEDSSICVMEKGEFLNLISGKPQLSLKMMEFWGQRLRQIQDKLEDLLFKNTEARLSCILLELTEEYGKRKGEGIEIDFRITHQELADLVGSARESVTTVLNRFEREGILTKSRYSITIKDIDKLEHKTNFH